MRNKDWERNKYAIIGIIMMIVIFGMLFLMVESSRGAIHGDTDSIPPEPKAFATFAFPANYQSDPTSRALLSALSMYPEFRELRRVAQTTSYAENDPDFRHRWLGDEPEKRLPDLVVNRAPCLFLAYYAQNTPTPTYCYRTSFGPNGRKTIEQVARELRDILPRLRYAVQHNWQPAPGTFVGPSNPIPYTQFASGPRTVTYTYTYSYGRPRIRIFRPRNPDNCPDCVNPVVGPSNPIQPTDDPNAPIRPLLPPIDETVSYPPDSEPTTPPQDPNAPLIPNNPELPPAPVEPPPPDPRIDEQAEQIREQAEEIKKLQATIHQLQQTVVNVTPSKDYAPDINALKGDIRDIRNAQANYQNEQNKINNDVVVSLKNVLAERTNLLKELEAVKTELAKPVDLDKLAADIAPKLPPVEVEWETLDGEKLTQSKHLGAGALKFKSVVVERRLSDLTKVD